MKFDKRILLKTFSDIPRIIENYVLNIPVDKIDLIRSESAWTIREHVNHIVTVQEMLYQRIKTIQNEERPIIKPYFPENEVDLDKIYFTLNDAFRQFKIIRNQQIKLINRLGKNDFLKEAEHGEYIRYNIPVIINHMISHEYWHLYRIEELWLTKDEYFK